MADRRTRPKQQQITFFYEKASQSRAIRAAGAFGSVLPDFGVYMALFSEHLPLPERTTHSLSPDGKALVETSRVMRDGVVRQIEVEVFLAADTVVALRDWLNDKIEAINKVKDEIEKAGTENKE